MAEMLGYTVDAMLGRELFGFMDAPGAFEARTRFARRQRGIAERHEFRWRHADGRELLTTVSASPLHAPDGAFAGALAFVSDVTEQRRAEAALRDSQAGLGLALSAAGMVVWERDLQTERLRNLVSEPDEAASAARPNAFGTFAAFLAAVHAEDRDRVARTHRDAVARGGDFSHQFRITGQQGQLRWMQSTGRVLAGDDGRPARVIGLSLDVTERIALEAQLRQAQKMEAVGQLAGGVAHDFNNLLTVITAATRFARESLPPDNPAGEDIAAIDAAAARAAQLTRQLLAFSRKQLLKPERLDVSRVAREAEQMLRRLIGADVEIVADLAPGLPLVLADPGQLEQVLINLAVNARDAMPDGGRLTLRTAAVTVTPDEAARLGAGRVAGAYVRLSVRDSGIGMESDTLARLFEPFFTTKAPGKGTGLGLATVYGIVKQSGGYVWVTSAPGAGTTFEIDLPAAATPTAEAVDPRADDMASGAAMARVDATLLLVEDDVAVRVVTRRILVRHGYTVLEAAHGAAALEVLDRHAGPVDLVLTDVVMPQMSGRAFAQELERRRPGVRVLFMSGYTDDEILRRGVLAPGVGFLEKPFTAERLLGAVRDGLQSRGAPPP
jgi:PAS domain S-box-containing protein